jgi:hypothetical protein
MTESATTTVELFAGVRPDGQPVFERLPALPDPQGDRLLLMQSPLFVRGIAQGDLFRLLPGRPGAFDVVERSGQLAVRIYARAVAEPLAAELTPAMEKLGGRLDLAAPRALVYSIHVAVGFREIEQLLEQRLSGIEASWSYGNVYDDSGEPLRWWEVLLNP